MFEAEAAEDARLGALAVVARVLHKVRNLSRSVIKWNVWFSNEFARWAAQNAAVVAGWAAEQAEDEAEWAAGEAILTLKIGKMVRGGLTRTKHREAAGFPSSLQCTWATWRSCSGCARLEPPIKTKKRKKA